METDPIIRGHTIDFDKPERAACCRSKPVVVAPEGQEKGKVVRWRGDLA